MRIRPLVRAAAAVAALCLAPAVGAESADTAKFLTELGFTGDTIAQVRAGRMVKIGLAASNDRELAIGQALKREPTSAIEAQVKMQLLARYRAYRAKGLAGIAPYARGGGERTARADLRSAVEAASVVKGPAPAYYDVRAGRPSTDQVAGFGGSAKRSMGTQIMASQLEDPHTKVASATEAQ